MASSHMVRPIPVCSTVVVGGLVVRARDTSSNRPSLLRSSVRMVQPCTTLAPRRRSASACRLARLSAVIPTRHPVRGPVGSDSPTADFPHGASMLDVDTHHWILPNTSSAVARVSSSDHVSISSAGRPALNPTSTGRPVQGTALYHSMK